MTPSVDVLPAAENSSAGSMFFLWMFSSFDEHRCISTIDLSQPQASKLHVFVNQNVTHDLLEQDYDCTMPQAA